MLGTLKTVNYDKFIVTLISTLVILGINLSRTDAPLSVAQILCDIYIYTCHHVRVFGKY